MDDTLVARVGALDLAAVQATFARDLAPDAPYHHREATALEYRRFLILTLRHPGPELRPGGPVGRFHRLHAALPRFPADCAALTEGTGVEPGRLVPPPGPPGSPPDVRFRDLYLRTFPCGDADLWGWRPASARPRVSAPGLGLVHTALRDAVDAHMRDDLRREALSLRPGASDSHSPAFTIERGCVSGGAGGFRSVEAGPVLWGRHWSGSLAHRVGEATGTVVVPTGVFYNYHSDGDGSPLHNDPFATELVVLTLLDGPVEPLHLHPELADAPLSEVRALAERTGGCPDGGEPFDIGPTPFLMSGQTIPHHRCRARREADVVVAAQFFGVLAAT